MKGRSEYGLAPVVVNTLFDGQIFGEMGLIEGPEEKKNARNASVRAQEDSYLLRVEPAAYLEVMKRSVDQDQVHKLVVMRKVPFLANCNAQQLSPLAAHVEAVYLALGDEVIRQGEVPSGTYILAEGVCRYSAPDRKGLSPERPKVAEFFPRLSPSEVAECPMSPEKPQAGSRRSADRLKEAMWDYGYMRPGNFFGVGGLVDMRGRCPYASMLTCTVDSCVAKFYVFHRKSLLFLPEAVMLGVLQEAERTPDPIRPTDEQLEDMLLKHWVWETEKHQICDSHVYTVKQQKR